MCTYLLHNENTSEVHVCKSPNVIACDNGSMVITYPRLHCFSVLSHTMKKKRECEWVNIVNGPDVDILFFVKRKGRTNLLALPYV